MDDQVRCEVPQFDAYLLRAELFKLFYASGKFNLHDKDDAFECLDQILGLMHGWVSTAGTTVQFQTTFDVMNQPCQQGCFVHSCFYQ